VEHRIVGVAGAVVLHTSGLDESDQSAIVVQVLNLVVVVESEF